MSAAEIGPWEPKRRFHYANGPRKWVLERTNPHFRGWPETLLTKALNERRFSSEEAASKVAEELNSGGGK